MTIRKSEKVEGFATVAEVSQFLNLSRTFIYGMMEKGELPYIQFGRTRRISWRLLREIEERGK
ncbi:helix-turn-helix domain-containing protein [bacterium]|nr:helix-turn-helix domain-containing protein [bacterium]